MHLLSNAVKSKKPFEPFAVRSELAGNHVEIVIEGTDSGISENQGGTRDE